MKSVARILLGALAATIVLPVDAGADAPAGRYTTTSTTVFDTKTKLTWQRAPVAGTFIASDARNSACTTPWRLPSYKELLTLVDFSRSSPAIDTNAFPSTPSASFWTITYVPGDPTVSTYVVDFATGNGFATDPTALNNVRCVR
jgi:hypothetical protein